MPELHLVLLDFARADEPTLKSPTNFVTPKPPPTISVLEWIQKYSKDSMRLGKKYKIW